VVFDGENVVECVVNVVGKLPLRGAKNMPLFSTLFFLAFPKWDGGDVEKQISPLRRSQKRERLRSK
jgi:hypothetical protein